MRNKTKLLLSTLLLAGTASAKCIIQQETVRVGNNIQQQMTETCDDNQLFDIGQIGFSGKLSLFREHPDFPKTFRDNGTVCKWFLDNTFADNEVKYYEGVICKVRDNWVVVDKF